MSPGIKQGWSDRGAALTRGSGARLAVPGWQCQAGSGQCWHWHPAPLLPAALEKGALFPGHPAQQWPLLSLGTGASRAAVGGVGRVAGWGLGWESRGRGSQSVSLGPEGPCAALPPMGTGGHSGALRWGSPTGGQGGQTPTLAGPERQPGGFVALGESVCPQLCSWVCTVALVPPG